MTMKSPTSWLSRFLFEEKSAMPLAAVRIATGFLVTIWSTMWIVESRTWLGPIRLPQAALGVWPVWPMAPDSIVLATGIATLASGLLMTIGLGTRVASWAAFLLMLFLQNLNPYSYNFGDQILRGVLVLGVALGPSGAYLSLDAARKGGSPKVVPRVSVFALRFIQLHISLGYLLTVVTKLTGDRWPGGNALFYALSLKDLMRFDLPSWLIAAPLGTVLTYVTLLVEATVALGVCSKRLRWPALAAGLALHLSIAAVMTIGLFSFVMIASYLAWLPESWGPNRRFESSTTPPPT